MANGLQALLLLVCKTNASNAVVVTGDTGAATGGTQSLGNVQGKTDSSNRLLVVFE